MTRNAELDQRQASSYLEETGCIFDIQRFSIHDGPGIRTLIFLKGCPLNCQWCSNPESQNPRMDFFYFEERCILCKRCEIHCKSKRIKYSSDMPIFDDSCLKHCIDFDCLRTCPNQAIVQLGKTVTVRDVLSIALRDQDYYYISNGGITISGGEPFYQEKFLEALVAALKSRNVHVCVETSGFFNLERNRHTVELIDLFLFDLKLSNETLHKRYTGKPNDSIVSNLYRLANMHRRVVLRVPIIPEVNDGPDELSGLVRIMAPIRKSVLGLSLLPYHIHGVSKYKRLVRAYDFHRDTNTAENIERVRNFFIGNDLEVID